MKNTEIEDIKQTIQWLLHNGDFKDTETAYNSAMNSINTLDEAINFTDSSLQLNEKEETVIEGIDTIYLDKNGNEMVLLSNITMTIEQYKKYTETIAKS